MWWMVAAAVQARRLLALLVALGAVVALALVFLQRPQFTTSFSFVPQAASDPAKSGLASLAGQFGVSIGAGGAQAQSPQFYADLLATREVLLPIATDSFSIAGEASKKSLADLYDERGATPLIVLDKVLQRLRKQMIDNTVATRTTGVVTVRVRALDPGLALGIAERLLDGINRFNLQTRQSQAAAERRFVGSRLDAARATLLASEQALQRFLSANRQIENSPQLSFERDRLEREVSTQQQLLSGLIQQYEDARIKEVRDTPVITVIERPVRPSRADSRRGVITVASGASLGLLLALIWVLGRAGARRAFAAPTDPDQAIVASWWRKAATTS